MRRLKSLPTMGQILGTYMHVFITFSAPNPLPQISALSYDLIISFVQKGKN